MQHLAVILVGLLAAFGAIVGQLIFPFAFDFVSTLAVYAAGVFIGRASKA